MKQSYIPSSYSWPSDIIQTNFASDVLKGLTLPQKRLDPKYLYDEQGSRLFERICLQPEYYLTRTETKILKAKSGEIIDLTCKDTDNINIIELGSGSSIKTRILVRSLLARRRNLNVHYFPIDVSYSALVESANAISGDFPTLVVKEIIADYESGLHQATKLISKMEDGSKKKIILFLGSSIGNMDENESQRFMAMLGRLMDPNDSLLVGFDLDKDPSILEAAYNDKAEVTASFNLNLLSRINNELDADFNLSDFAHRSFYNHDQRRIEMHLVSTKDQVVRIAALGEKFIFRCGETIHTENSYKYTRSKIELIARQLGLRSKHFTDRKKWYDLCLFTKS